MINIQNIANLSPYPYMIVPPMCNMYAYPTWCNQPVYNMWPYPNFNNIIYKRDEINLKDYGPYPFVVNINNAAMQNNNFRTTLWTGNNLQVTLMNINIGDDIGLEIHPQVDQFIRIEDGEALVKMGDSKDNLDFQRKVFNDYAIMIPAGKWHNIINMGNKPLKLYAIYAPPQHPRDTVHETKLDAESENHRYRY